MISITTEKALELLGALGVETATLPDYMPQTLLDAAADALSNLNDRVTALETPQIS